MHIGLDHLRKFGMNFSIPASRSKSKQAMANALVTYRAGKEQQEVSGTLEVTDKNNIPIRFNTKRYLNVLFSEVMKPQLARRGKSLNKQQLQDKLATDQEFFFGFLDKYNTDKP